MLIACCVVLCELLSLVLPTVARAEEITYTGFVVTDGKLGDWEFHNARVYLTYKGDTGSVQTMVFSNSPDSGSTQIEINSGGVSKITIVTSERTENATFAPGQIFVSLDLGDIFVPGPLPLSSFNGGRGVGFGSFSASSPLGVEPAYPLGLEDGMIDWGDVSDFSSNFASADLMALPMDLQQNVAYSGRADICVGFPTFGAPCSAPNPLQTDKGALLLYQRYQQVFQVNNL
jgi:hypothetical protein